MIRLLKCITDTGVNFRIRAILQPDLYDYEILVPESYKMIYKGFEGMDDKGYHNDFNLNFINDDAFENLITIVNMNPGEVDFEVPRTDDDAIAYYKDIVYKCSVILVFFEDKKIVDIQVFYDTTDPADCTQINSIVNELSLFIKSY